MEESSSSVSPSNFLDRKEEVIVDIYGNVFNPILSVCSILSPKNIYGDLNHKEEVF